MENHAIAGSSTKSVKLRHWDARTPIVTVLAIGAALLCIEDARAQDSEPVLEEVVVTGVRASLARSLELKRAANGVVDGITAEDITDFPDLNVSESLARVSGVTINRTLGEGNRVTVRGLNPEFTRITINGQTVTSGNAGREVDFDVFASELFSSVQLAKTPSASLTEGGLAATIDLRTARPFDYAGDAPVLALSLQAAQNDLRGEFNPRLSALAGSTFGGGTIGLLGSISYSDTALRQDNAEGLRFSPDRCGRGRGRYA